tara:strand:+ start:1138 stop:1764 length:627 start_codon:yes stop_codon:yes gene_type:complete
MKSEIKTKLSYYKVLGLLLITSIMGSCGVSNLVIEGSFPTPNINKIPLSMAIFYDDALREFSYMEYSETGREEINIESGESHIRLFNAVLPAMFDQVVEIEGMDDPKVQEVDAVFSPTIEEFQLALPEKTKLDVYEVWIKYNMRIVDRGGNTLADWVLTSYGKTPTATFLSVEDGINEAAIVALRDLASSFSLNFSQFPEVQDWLNNL